MATFTERDIEAGGRLLAARFGDDWFQRIDLDGHTQGSEGKCVADQLGGRGTWQDYSGYRDFGGETDNIWNDPSADSLWRQHILDLRAAAGDSRIIHPTSTPTISHTDELDDLTIGHIIERLDDAKQQVELLTNVLADRLHEIADDYGVSL